MTGRYALGALAALGTLAGCTTTTGPGDPSPQGSCRPEPGQRFVGMRATGELGTQMLAATRAQTLRWVPPNSAVTMDFNPSRLTVSYDDNYVITTVACT